MLPPLRFRIADRFELKYLLNQAQREAMMAALADSMSSDQQGDEKGRYAVTSLYYDTPDHRAYWDKLEGHRFRRKVRIRVYGEQLVTPETLCFIEIKQRINKTVQKKRIRLPYAAAVELCEKGVSVEGESVADQAIIAEVLYLYHTLQLQPSCIVGYNRLAFESSNYDPGLRVTFDTQLKCRAHDLTLLAHGYAEDQYFLPPPQSIMEVKVNYRTPYWLTELIGRYGCSFRRISKYCAALECAKLRLGYQQFI
jgi:SPX domain protein involved in polyphosphate accumulation